MKHLTDTERHDVLQVLEHIRILFIILKSPRILIPVPVPVPPLSLWFHHPGPEEELGRAAPGVPGPLVRHRHPVEEVPQAAARGGDEAAGGRHQPH